jgi:hypothetical protein
MGITLCNPTDKKDSPSFNTILPMNIRKRKFLISLLSIIFIFIFSSFLFSPHCDGSCDNSFHIKTGRIATAVMYCKVSFLLFRSSALFQIILCPFFFFFKGTNERRPNYFHSLQYSRETQIRISHFLLLFRARWSNGRRIHGTFRLSSLRGREMDYD